MVKVLLFILMDQYLRVNGKKALNVGKGGISSQMEIITLVTGKTIKCMVMGSFWKSRLGLFMKENGQRAISMGKVRSDGKMGVTITESSSRARKMVMVGLLQ
jgi:hypothetical protein